MELHGVRLRVISPIIAVVVLVAITLSIAFALVGWLFGLWGGLAGGIPQIAVTSAKVELGCGCKVHFTVVNKGAGSDKIIGVWLQKGNNVWQCEVKDGEVGPHEVKEVTYRCPAAQYGAGGVNSGDHVTVKVQFEKSGTRIIPAIATREVPVKVVDVGGYVSGPLKYGHIYVYVVIEKKNGLEERVTLSICNPKNGVCLSAWPEVGRTDYPGIRHYYTTFIVGSEVEKVKLWFDITSVDNYSDGLRLAAGDTAIVKVHFKKCGITYTTSITLGDW